jgi:hypothetical protein
MNHASPTVRQVLRQLPAPPRPEGLLGGLINDMHTALASGSHPLGRPVRRGRRTGGARHRSGLPGETRVLERGPGRRRDPGGGPINLVVWR